ncbi:MAG: 30S ribosomal protein S21 [Cyanobacteria bacterium J06642_2]
MTQINVGEDEYIESALRRFKKKLQKAGIFADIRRRRHFETTAEKRRRKAKDARRRSRRR